MKLHIDRALLFKSLTHAQSIVERRTTIPILSHIMLTAKDSTLTITATDLDLSFTQTLDAKVQAQGSVTVQAHMLYEIVKKASVKEECSLALDPQSGQLAIHFGKSEFVLPTLPPEEFPLFQQDALPYHMELSTAVLCQLIDSTKFAMALEETRYYLNGLYWHACQEGGKLYMVGTDGHRLARAQTALPSDAFDMPGIILSRKTITEIRKIMDGKDLMVLVDLSETQIRFTLDNMTLASRLIDGTFPDYQKVIPQANEYVLTVSADDFSQAIDRVSVITTERSRAVKLSLSENLLVISATNTDNGSAREELSVHYTGRPIEIGFNARYILDVTNQLKGDQVKILLSDATSPVIVYDTGDADDLFVLMPMRV